MKLLPIVIAVAGALHLPAQAQEVPAEAGRSAARDAGERMETVTVSARRRDERLQDVPLAVTAFSGRALERGNVQSLADLQERVPNLTVYASRGTNTTLTAFIRGVGQADPVWGVDPGVGIYFDDVYMARPQGALLDVFDVQRIEVLRGPQGTLYGKNTIGGAIKYISRPLGKENGASVEAGVGNYDQRNVKLALNGANEAGTVRARLAVAKLRRGGFGVNTYTGEPVSDQDSAAARLSLGYFPADLPFSVVLSADATDDNSHARGFQRMGSSAFDPLKRPPSTSPYDIASGMPGHNFTHNRGGALTASYTVTPAWSLKLIGAKRRSASEQTIDFDGLPQTIADVYGDSRDEQSSLELQASYSGDAGSGVIGLYRFEGKAGGRIFNNFLGKQFTAADSTVDTDSTALYTDWTVPLGELWSVNAGLRHTREEKRALVLNRAFADPAFRKPIMTLADFDKSLAVSNTSPKLSLRYKASETTNLYGNVSRGFKSGGYNVRANNLAVPDSSHPYRDEKLDSLEVGAKYASADDSFDVNAALFLNRYKDIQLSVFTSYTQANGLPGFYGDFTNAGKASVKGAEIEFAWRPNRQWDVSGFAAFLHASYDEYMSGGKDIAAQQKFSNTPRAQFGLNVTRTDRDVMGGTLRTLAGYGYRSKVYPTTDLSETIAQPGYGLWTAGLVWEAARHWTVSLHGSNLSNVRYRTDGYNIPALYILDGFYGPPRQVIARAAYRF
ncbi:TonB-dependent receptor [Janthinobacterium fluminis]|uniref:TonB-dependent receptor n=1 Tax=Janthinobacterium fluminis TaxID=2987524 RepID=A0ABT5JWT4_9BURK|nr:TonB-dependent receptor [Janthinobacterium fluminis]MDC8757099.1 TonB-dependent receptor [Janthinobacterium fluminis]